MTKVCDKFANVIAKVCDKLQMCVENPRVFLRTHLCLAVDHLCVKLIHV